MGKICRHGGEDVKKSEIVARDFARGCWYWSGWFARIVRVDRSMPVGERLASIPYGEVCRVNFCGSQRCSQNVGGANSPPPVARS